MSHDANASNKSVKITEIPMELLLMIYKNIDLSSLINVAKTHPYNHRAAGVIFKDKFANEKFVIDGLNRGTADFVTKYGNTFDLNVMLNALHQFSHLIKKLTIDYGPLNVKQSEKLNEYVSVCVADSLIEIELNGCHDHKLNGLRGPFKRVEFVHLRYGNIDSNGINFNEIFPVMRVFDVQSMLSMSQQSIEHYFINLKEMHTEYYLVNDLPRLKQRLQLNPQLERLSVFKTNWNGLRMISENAPTLEWLDVNLFENLKSSFDFQVENIRFPNIKVFRMFDYMPSAMERVPLVFGNLEEITCNQPIDKWLQIILQNKQLKRINCCEVNGEHLQQITGELANLEEFRAKYNTVGNDSIEKLVRFIENSNRLQTVIFSNMDMKYCDEIGKRLQHKWKIIEENNVFVLTRR